jgi:hypothetical protein
MAPTMDIMSGRPSGNPTTQGLWVERHSDMKSAHKRLHSHDPDLARAGKTGAP